MCLDSQSPEICDPWLSRRTGSFPLLSLLDLVSRRYSQATACSCPRKTRARPLHAWSFLNPTPLGTHGPSFSLKTKSRHLADVLRLLAHSTLRFYSDHYPFLLPKYIKNNLNGTQSKENIFQVKLQSGPKRITGESLLFPTVTRKANVVCVCV